MCLAKYPKQTRVLLKIRPWFIHTSKAVQLICGIELPANMHFIYDINMLTTTKVDSSLEIARNLRKAEL